MSAMSSLQNIRPLSRVISFLSLNFSYLHRPSCYSSILLWYQSTDIHCSSLSLTNGMYAAVLCVHTCVTFMLGHIFQLETFFLGSGTRYAAPKLCTTDTSFEHRYSKDCQSSDIWCRSFEFTWITRPKKYSEQYL